MSDQHNRGFTDADLELLREFLREGTEFFRTQNEMMKKLGPLFGGEGKLPIPDLRDGKLPIPDLSEGIPGLPDFGGEGPGKILDSLREALGRKPHTPTDLGEDQEPTTDESDVPPVTFEEHTLDEEVPAECKDDQGSPPSELEQQIVAAGVDLDRLKHHLAEQFHMSPHCFDARVLQEALDSAKLCPGIDTNEQALDSICAAAAKKGVNVFEDSATGRARFDALRPKSQ